MLPDRVAPRLLYTGSTALGRHSGGPTNIQPTRRGPFFESPLATYGHFTGSGIAFAGSESDGEEDG